MEEGQTVTSENFPLKVALAVSSTPPLDEVAVGERDRLGEVGRAR